MSDSNSHTTLRLLIFGAFFTPAIVFGSKDCRVIEYPDHYEAVCIGDPNYAAKLAEQKDSNVDVSKGAQASRKRQRIEDVRSLNARRFDAVESQAASDTVKTRK